MCHNPNSCVIFLDTGSSCPSTCIGFCNQRMRRSKSPLRTCRALSCRYVVYYRWALRRPQYVHEPKLNDEPYSVTCGRSLGSVTGDIARQNLCNVSPSIVLYAPTTDFKICWKRSCAESQQAITCR